MGSSPASGTIIPAYYNFWSTPLTISIEVFSDYVCPWCYLGSASVKRLEETYPVEISWVPFPLHPDTPQEGLLLTELFRGRDMTVAQAALEARMEEAGLEYGYREKTYNSRLAQELAKWADTQPGGKAIHEALFRAYFVHGKNLANKTVLLDTVESIGLDRPKAQDILESRSWKEAVDADWHRARQYQITGVPCFVSNRLMLPGCQPWETLEKFYLHIRETAGPAE